MPYFVLIGRDRPGAAALRQAIRPAHQAYFYAPRADCCGVAGGPLLDDEGREMIGSLLVFEAENRSAVDRFVADDPYVQAGLFAATEIVPWRWGLGRPASQLNSNPGQT